MSVGDLVKFSSDVYELDDDSLWGIIIEQLIPEEEGYRVLFHDGDLAFAYEHELEVISENR